MGTEFELKYSASALQMDAIRNSFGPFREIRMETTYYDTPDRLLSHRKWTYRQRFENGISVCTLKTPGKENVRGEWEAEWNNISTAAEVLCKLGAPEELMSLTKTGVVEVCGARFTRLACPVTLEDCTLELALDQGVLTGGGREEPLLEIEVELKSGSEAAAAAFAARLAGQHGLTCQPASKFKRALNLALGK